MAQDHSFKVSNGRTGQVALVTDSWSEATLCQYRNNVEETAVGYEPVWKIWITDVDGVECIIKTQL